MKKVSISAIFAILTLMFIAGGIAHEVKGNAEAAQRCYVAAFAAVIVPAVMAIKNVQDMQSAPLAFMNKQFLNLGDRPFTVAENALWNHIMGSKSAKEQTKKDLESGLLRIQTYTEAFRFEIADAATGTIELLNAATVYVEGAIPADFQGGTLPDGFNIAVSHIGLGFVADAAVTTAKAAIALATQPNAWPAALRNARLRFSQSGAVKANIACLYTGPFAASTGRPVEDDGLELQSPFILEERAGTKIELLAGTNAFASPAGGNFLEVKLYGAYISNRF